MEPHLIPHEYALQILQNLSTPPPAVAAAAISHTDSKLRQVASERFQSQDVLDASLTLVEMIKTGRSIEPLEEAIESAMDALGILAAQDEPAAIQVLTQLSTQIEAHDVMTPLLARIRSLNNTASLSPDEIQFFKNVQKLYGQRKVSDDEIVKFHEFWQQHPAKATPFLKWSEDLVEARQKTIHMIRENGKHFPFANLSWNEKVSSVWVELNVSVGFDIPSMTRLYLQSLLDQTLLDNIQIHTDSLRLCTYAGGGETLLSTLETGDRGLKKRGLREGETPSNPDIRILENEGESPLILRERAEGSPVFQAEDWKYVRYTDKLAFISGTRFIYFAHREGEPRRAFATLDLTEARLKNNQELDSYLNFLAEMSAQGLIENNGKFFDLWLTKANDRDKMTLLNKRASKPIKQLVEQHLSGFTPEQQLILLNKTIQFNYDLYTQMTIQRLMLGH